MLTEFFSATKFLKKSVKYSCMHKHSRFSLKNLQEETWLIMIFKTRFFSLIINFGFGLTAL